VVVLTGCVLCTVPAIAQAKTTFDPAVAVEEGYDDNVFYTATNAMSDSVTRLNLDLPLHRESRTGTLDVRYRPSLWRYADFSELDRDEHDLRVDWGAQPDPRTRLRLITGYRKTQEQGNAASVETNDLFLGRRADRDRIEMAFDLQREQNPRWNWGFNVSGSDTNYTLVLDPSVDPSTIRPPEDKLEYGADLRFSRNVSRTTRIGGTYGHREFDPQRSGRESADRVAMTWERDLADRLTVGLAIGAYHSSQDASSVNPASSRSGVSFELHLTRLYETTRLTVSANHLPSSGGVLQGTATTSVVGVTWANLNRRYWNWRLSPRWTRRDPSDPTDFKRQTVGLSASVERVLGKRFGVRLRGRAINQSDDEPGVPDRSNAEAYLAFVWYPLGGTALGG